MISVESVLSASRGVMQVRITYQAYLRGYTAVNYGDPYQEHHFWALPIGPVMSAAGISNSKISTEDIKIGFYSNSKIELKDTATGASKQVFLMTNVPGVTTKTAKTSAAAQMA
ncbi:hypothetical protein [Segetibacter koreensis]|uniref:hypothetical protein n=1 Tax=Segetibacter koreensis TaxID=398037 RepID=UPI0003A6F108|nr:hypothetical protein [Segetibacter koreensis]